MALPVAQDMHTLTVARTRFQRKPHELKPIADANARALETHTLGVRQIGTQTKFDGATLRFELLSCRVADYTLSLANHGCRFNRFRKSAVVERQPGP